MPAVEKVYLMVGTHKGGFLFISDPERNVWIRKGPFFRGTDVHYMMCDIRQEPTIYACVNSTWWGSDIRFSKDWGDTWQEPKEGIRFPEGSGHEVKRVWYIAPGNNDTENVMYAGVDPGALFLSENSGLNWHEVKSLTEHPSREKWTPGMGGMMVHSICVHPDDSSKLHVGISAAGTFTTEDGGQTWSPRNRGVQADFLAEKFPEVGQCVHHMASHPGKPEVLYQQNHCGVYRSDNEGHNWIDLNDGLPSRFGFPLVIHPHDPDTIYVIPEESPEFRCPVGAALAVYRSTDRGTNWQRLETGLPQQHAYLNIYRHAMCTDRCQSAGIYFGTSTGQIFFSRNDGDNWELLTNWLPPVFSLHCVVL